MVTGDARFFAITKRIHNKIHGDPGGGPLGEDDAGHYAHILAANAHELLAQMRPGDLVLDNPPEARQKGEAAHAYIREHYVGDLHLLRYAQLFSGLL